jgi:hypothetical protein
VEKQQLRRRRVARVTPAKNYGLNRGNKMTDIDTALDLIGRGAEEIIKREDLQARLKLGRPIRPRRICIWVTPSCSTRCASFRIWDIRSFF